MRLKKKTQQTCTTCLRKKTPNLFQISNFWFTFWPKFSWNRFHGKIAKLPCHPSCGIHHGYRKSSCWSQYDDGNPFDQHVQRWTGFWKDAMHQYRRPFEDLCGSYVAISYNSILRLHLKGEEFDDLFWSIMIMWDDKKIKCQPAKGFCHMVGSNVLKSYGFIIIGRNMSTWM